MSTVKGGYICRTCGLDQWFDVRERAPEEGIENYVYHVGRMAGEHHSKQNVGCPASALDIKIPMSGNGIGFVGPDLTDEEKAELAKKFNRSGPGPCNPAS